MSVISRAVTFLKHSNGTAVSNGNSSYPLMRRALGSGHKRKQGILVNAEYMYLRSVLMACLAFSFLESCELDPRPKDDHREDIPDMTLFTEETECMDRASDDLLLR